jgi:hypothetical protein
MRETESRKWPGRDAPFSEDDAARADTVDEVSAQMPSKAGWERESASRSASTPASHALPSEGAHPARPPIPVTSAAAGA